MRVRDMAMTPNPNQVRNRYPFMTSRIEPTHCALCETTPLYLTPFGVLCPEHADAVISKEDTWKPILIRTNTQTLSGLPQRPEWR